MKTSGRWKSHIPPEHKVCSLCKKVLPADNFSPRINRPGRDSRCRGCNNERRQAYRKPEDGQRYYANQKSKDPEFYRETNLRKNYGIGIAEFESILLDQGGKCAVCEGPALGKGRYHVDHDHKTGQIRGLLCHKCNVALGMVQDSIPHLLLLVRYLNEARKAVA